MLSSFLFHPATNHDTAGASTPAVSTYWRGAAHTTWYCAHGVSSAPKSSHRGSRARHSFHAAQAGLHAIGTTGGRRDGIGPNCAFRGSLPNHGLCVCRELTRPAMSPVRQLGRLQSQLARHDKRCDKHRTNILMIRCLKLIILLGVSYQTKPERSETHTSLLFAKRNHADVATLGRRQLSKSASIQHAFARQ